MLLVTVPGFMHTRKEALLRRSEARLGLWQHSRGFSCGAKVPCLQSRACSSDASLCSPCLHDLFQVTSQVCGHLQLLHAVHLDIDL